MIKLGTKSLALAAILTSAAAASAQTTLTGIVWYTTNSAKQYDGGYANTYGGDTYSRNLYVTENQAVGGGPLLNAANLTTLPTRVNVDLNTPGNYTFQMYCNDESSTLNSFWGMNLFFNGDDTKSGISVWNVVNVAGFQTINSVGTPTLDPLTMGLIQSGSGAGASQTYVGGGVEVKLTSYSTWSTTHYNVDRIDNFTDNGGLGNGTKDQVIEFGLQVKSVPEPGTILSLAGASLAMILRRRLRRAGK